MKDVEILQKLQNCCLQFIHNYKKWRQKGYDISTSNDHTRNQAFSSSMPIDDIIKVTRPLSMRYLEMEIPCPFLVNDTCYIYAVRPLPCSGQYSVSPPDWCALVTENKAEIHQVIPDDDDLMKFLKSKRQIFRK